MKWWKERVIGVVCVSALNYVFINVESLPMKRGLNDAERYGSLNMSVPSDPEYNKDSKT